MSTLIIAHRGAMIEAPENTRSAYNKALSYSVDGIELDVQITGDGIPVVYHDESLQKINGSFNSIADFTLKDLSRFDWGAWFSVAFKGEQVLTLEEALTAYGDKTRLLIEIKPAPKKYFQELYSRLAVLVTESIRNIIPQEKISNIFILSFDPEIIKSAYLNDSDLNYVLNLEFQTINDDSLNIDSLNIDPAILYGYCLEHDILTARFVENCHDNGKKVMTYSCNSIETIQNAIDSNVDVIMTDDPGGDIWDQFYA